MPENNKAPLTFAITGSAGKTTSILLARYILEQSGLTPVALDTWKGSQSFHRIKALAGPDSDCFLAEIPLNILRQRHLDTEQFQLIAISNLASPCSGEEGTWQAKAVAGFLDNMAEGTAAVFNADDPESLALAREGLSSFMTYAIGYQNAMILAKDVAFSGLTCRFSLTVNTEFINLAGQVVMPGSYPVFLPVGGRHNISNLLLSVCLCLQLGVGLEAISAALASFPGIRRNLETIYDGDFKVIDDAAQNPGALEASLTAIAALPAQKMIVLYGITGGGGAALNEANARKLAAWLRQQSGYSLILTRSMYHSPKKYRVEIAEEKACLGALKEESIHFSYYPDLPDALESAVWQAQSGDAVVLLGGPVLNRAAGLILRILGNPGSQAVLVPSAIPSVTDLYTQQVTANPT